MSGTQTVAVPEWVWVPKAARIAREAGARLREFFAEGVATEYKGDVDLVTVADRTSEKLIRERLAEAFPGHGIFGEEGTRDRLDADFRWYVDPLDGTTNFAHGFPQFCVSLGLEDRRVPEDRRAPEPEPQGQNQPQRLARLSPDEDGTLVAAVLYDPMRDELFVAERGRGAWLNGRPIRVSRVPELSEALVATGFPSRKRHENPNIHFYQEFTLRSHGVRRLLGVQPQSLGHGGRHPAGRGGGRAGYGLFWRAFPAGQPGDSGLERADPRRIDGPFRGYVRRTQALAHSHTPGAGGAAGKA